MLLTHFPPARPRARPRLFFLSQVRLEGKCVSIIRAGSDRSVFGGESLPERYSGGARIRRPGVYEPPVADPGPARTLVARPVWRLYRARTPVARPQWRLNRTRTLVARPPWCEFSATTRRAAPDKCLGEESTAFWSCQKRRRRADAAFWSCDNCRWSASAAVGSCQRSRGREGTVVGPCQDHGSREPSRGRDQSSKAASSPAERSILRNASTY